MVWNKLHKLQEDTVDQNFFRRNLRNFVKNRIMLVKLPFRSFSAKQKVNILVINISMKYFISKLSVFVWIKTKLNSIRKWSNLTCQVYFPNPFSTVVYSKYILTNIPCHIWLWLCAKHGITKPLKALVE